MNVKLNFGRWAVFFIIILFGCQSDKGNSVLDDGTINLVHTLFKDNNKLNLYYKKGGYELTDLKHFCRNINYEDSKQYDYVLSQFYTDMHYVNVLKKNPKAPFEEIKTGKTIKAQLVKNSEKLELFWYNKNAWESEPESFVLD